MPATILMSRNDLYGWRRAERDALIRRLLPFRIIHLIYLRRLELRLKMDGRAHFTPAGFGSFRFH